MFKQYLEAAQQERAELIPVPKGYEWTSNAGGFFSYDKVLKNGNVIALSGKQGNSKLKTIDSEEDNSDNQNAAFVYKDDQKDGEPLKMHFFKTEAELKTILAKIDK
jgi:hypothetical protein